MIINPRGTFGSGKSTIIRKIMERYDEKRPMYREGRKKPFGYQCVRSDGPDLWVVGHYEGACGGADTIPTIDEVYQQVNHAASIGYDVAFEGAALVIHDWRRMAATAKIYPHLVVILDIPIQLALEGVKARREARGDDRELDPKNTIILRRDLERNEGHLRRNGVHVASFLNRERATEACLKALGWNS